MSDYSQTISILEKKDNERISMARAMIMSYPYYSTEDKIAWMDALDGLVITKERAYLSAKQALEEALGKRKKEI